MAINTVNERIASSTFGMAWIAGVRRPTATSSDTLRASTLGLYQVDSLGTPVVGWTVGRAERTFGVRSNSRVWSVSNPARAWRIPERST